MTGSTTPVPDPLAERVRGYLTVHSTSDQETADDALAEARALVENWIGDRISAFPKVIVDRAIVEVTAELFYRKSARNGVMEFAGTDLAPFRIARDPMKAAYPILKQFMPGGLA